MSNTVKTRDEIEQKYTWDLESMYPDAASWEADLEKAEQLAQAFTGYAGTLHEGADRLLSALELQDKASRALEKAYVYARMRRDEDNGNETAQAMCDQATGKVAKISGEMAFFVPEIVSLGEAKIKSYLAEEDALSPYEFFLTQIIREQAHILSDKEEALLARLGEVMSAQHDVFTMLNNADLSFGEVADEDGNTVTLTHGNYINFLQSHDRAVRKAAYDKMYDAFEGVINTIGATYNASVKRDCTMASIRGYGSARAGALYPENILESVYDSLVEAVHDALPHVHRYMEIRKRALGVDELAMYDVYAPLVEIPKRVIPYEESQEIILKALAPLGETYLADLKQGFSERWADVYETKGKTSGAYSFGSYDSKPFVLLNYTDTLQDVFTVVHEMGHSMNSLYTRRTQPYIYGDHSIFTAEVASTVNENLLMHYLLETEKDEAMQKYLTAMHIEEFRTTLFRQTMFAEFEDKAHRHVEQGGSLTPTWLSDTYEELNRLYFGPALANHDKIRFEWARIPHFYNAFYVYQYATGYSAATAICEKILAGGPYDYLEFLKHGDDDFPIELLKIAGVDMGTKEPVLSAMEVFASLVDRLEQML